MPFWAIYMIVCALLALMGWRDRGWVVPVTIFAGLLGVRLTPYLPSEFHELGSCTVWIGVSWVLLRCKAPVASFLIAISALVYLPLMVVGFRIEFMGLLPIISDLFLILAVGAGGANIVGKHLPPRNHPRDSFGLRADLGVHSEIVASRKASFMPISGD